MGAWAAESSDFVRGTENARSISFQTVPQRKPEKGPRRRLCYTCGEGKRAYIVQPQAKHYFAVLRHGLADDTKAIEFWPCGYNARCTSRIARSKQPRSPAASTPGGPSYQKIRAAVAGQLEAQPASLFGPMRVSYGAFAASVHVPFGPELQVHGHRFSDGTFPVSSVVRNLAVPVGPPT